VKRGTEQSDAVSVQYVIRANLAFRGFAGTGAARARFSGPGIVALRKPAVEPGESITTFLRRPGVSASAYVRYRGAEDEVWTLAAAHLVGSGAVAGGANSFEASLCDELALIWKRPLVSAEATPPHPTVTRECATSTTV